MFVVYTDVILNIIQIKRIIQLIKKKAIKLLKKALPYIIFFGILYTFNLIYTHSAKYQRYDRLHSNSYSYDKSEGHKELKNT